MADMKAIEEPNKQELKFTDWAARKSRLTIKAYRVPHNC